MLGFYCYSHFKLVFGSHISWQYTLHNPSLFSLSPGWNGCMYNNGGCQYLCLAQPKPDGNQTRGNQCACPTHHTLINNTCIPPKSFLLYSKKSDISRLLVPEEGQDASPDMILPIKGLGKLKSVDYDPVKGMVYWIDGKSKMIKRAKLDGSEVGILNFVVYIGTNEKLLRCSFETLLQRFKFSGKKTCHQNLFLCLLRLLKTKLL